MSNDCSYYYQQLSIDKGQHGRELQTVESNILRARYVRYGPAHGDVKQLAFSAYVSTPIMTHSVIVQFKDYGNTSVAIDSDHDHVLIDFN